MRKHAILPRAAAALVLALVLIGPANLRSLATTGGPPGGFTNAPGEANCTACHTSFPLDSGTAGFQITPPSAFVPNGTLQVTVAFSNTASPKHGFQITARDGSGNFPGGWQAVQPGITKNAFGSPAHHEHTATGTAQSLWVMDWLAPATLPNGPVTFYACGNQTNANNQPDGDHIYSAKAKVYQATLSTPSLAWPINTTHPVTLSAPGHSGELYFIVVSEDPTPVSFGGPFELEVNPFTGLFDVALQLPQIFSGLIGTVNASGQGTATVAVPNLPSIQGLVIHFGGITADAFFNPTEVTNRVTVTLQ